MEQQSDLSQIMEICRSINEVLQIEPINMEINNLRSKKWYFQVLQIIFPYLSEKFQKAGNIGTHESCLDALLILLVEQQLIEEDFLDIKGNSIVEGDFESIYYLVKLLNSFVERYIGTQEQIQDNQHNDSQQQKPEPDFYLLDSHRNGNQNSQKECHSVLGIKDQFQQSEYDDEKGKFEDSTPKPMPYIYNAPIANSVPPVYPSMNGKQSQQSQSSYSPYLRKQKGSSKVKEYKSEQKIKKITNNDRKGEKIKNKIKKLVHHPTLQKQNQKASNPESKKLTKAVIKVVKQNRKPTKIIKSLENTQFRKHMMKKQNEVRQFEKNYVLQKAQKHKMRQKNAKHNQSSNYKLEKVLKWREAKIAKQRKQLEEAIRIKVEAQKQHYLNTINTLILKLQRKKQIQDEKDFKADLLRENKDAAKRMTALEKWYQDRVKLMRQRKTVQGGQRILMRSGHKEIIRQIEKDLKKENEQKVAALIQRYRGEENKIESDLAQLTHKIINIYKKY